MSDKLKSKVDYIENIKKKANDLMENMSSSDIGYVIGTARRQLIIKTGKNPESHFICPITSKVLSKKSGKKIITEKIEAKTTTSTSWYYISVKAFNKIISSSAKGGK